MHTKIIYNENFFFTRILQSRKEIIDELILNKESSYSVISIPKKSGLRQLSCIDKNNLLYTLQKNLTNNFLNFIPLSNNAFGFVKGYSYQSFLEPHINTGKSNRYFLRLDINNFFGSIKADLIRNVFSYYVKTDKKELNEEIVNCIVELTTLNGILPQGAITSPVISNIVFRQLDIRIQEYCYKLDAIYSRYADDLLFSSNNNKLLENFFTGSISKIINSKGFTINYPKTKRGIGEVSLNGFVVGSNLRISRKKKEDISKILYVLSKGGKPLNVQEYLDRSNSQTYNSIENTFSSANELINYLCGYRAFLIQWLPKEQSNNKYKKIKNLINRIQDVVIDIENVRI